MGSIFNLSKPNRTIHVGVILTGGTTEILDVAPVDLLSGISQSIHKLPDNIVSPEHKKEALDIEFHWVNETGETAKLTAGLQILATVRALTEDEMKARLTVNVSQDSFETCPPLDIVLMGANEFAYQINERELEFVRKSYDDCSAFISICGGSQACLEAGLLKGKTATGPNMMLDMLKGRYPETNWEKKRWQRDGKLWTSGTLLNGLDLMRAFGEETYGGEGTLMNNVLDICAWPVRDVNYADVKA